MKPAQVATYKIVLCGEGGVGKTSIASVYTGGVFNPYMKLTVGIDYFTKMTIVDNTPYKIVIWDLGGEKRFRLLAPVFLRGARGAVFVFDITREETFTSIPEWLKITREVVGDIPKVLVGNKVDLDYIRMVPRSIAESYAEKEGFIAYIETSAKNNFNINKPFDLLINQIIHS